MYKLLFVLIVSITHIFARSIPEANIETTLNYKLNIQSLSDGNFQYFYTLLKQSKTNDKDKFENLHKEMSETKADVIAGIFLPLDTKRLWDPKDDNFLAVSKFNYILPINIKSIKENIFTSREYLQKTLPTYKVTQHKDYFHVGGSFMTPDFNVYLSFLKADHPYTKLMKDVDVAKMRDGKMKVSFMHQDNFGRVMFFRTAKMASAMIIYEQIKSNQTLITQYILSNIINVPTKNLIKKGMIENLQNVVQGSRSAVKEL
jgi:hypothetical protein